MGRPSFFAGLIGAPRFDVGEFSSRINIAVDCAGLRIDCLEAYCGEGGEARVPFYAVQTDFGGSHDPRALIESMTPYRVVSYKLLDPARLDMSALRRLRALTLAGRPVRRGDLEPRPKPCDPSDPFDGLVGMDEVKGTILKVGRAVERSGDALDALHMAFTGPPGTGKTEVARRMVSFFDSLGVTDGSGNLQVVGEADLVAKYVGHTAPKVKAAVERSLGGVLFIDEFYAIANSEPFGREAIDCLVDQLDSRRREFVCVVAGYKDEVDRTLDMNPGLRDRFAFEVSFRGYTPGELAEIFSSFLARKGFSLDESARGESLEAACARLMSRRGFANARTMRKLADRSIVEHVWKTEDREDRVICPGDIEAAASSPDMAADRQKVGF